MPRRSLEERIQLTKSKLQKEAARLADLQKQSSKAARAADTRDKIQLGGLVKIASVAYLGDSPALMQRRLQALLDGHLDT